jgi:hypothetical protein
MPSDDLEQLVDQLFESVDTYKKQPQSGILIQRSDN